MTHSKASHKYLFKAFYRQITKKKYKFQVLKYNICHIIVIAMQNAILITQVIDRYAKKNSLFLIHPIERLNKYAVQ